LGPQPTQVWSVQIVHDKEQSYGDRDPRHHIRNMQARLQETIEHLREDIGKVDEPQLKAMFETAAEVLTGLKKAFGDYEQKNESAWRK
jgi:hypothetical protein